MSESSLDRAARVEALDAATTVGPWKLKTEHAGSGDFDTRVEAADGKLVCDLWDNGNNVVDGELIAAYRTLAPKLAADVREMWPFVEWAARQKCVAKALLDEDSGACGYRKFNSACNEHRLCTPCRARALLATNLVVDVSAEGVG